MKVVRMKAERRTALGRNQVAQLRKEGWLPAVVYGEGQEPVSIAISEWELDQHVKQHHKVFDLDIGGVSTSAFLQDISWKATTDRALHADFKRIDLTKPIEADLEVTLVGHPVGLGKGGVLSKDHLVISISCLPTAIPELLEFDISGLDIDQALTAGSLPLPEGVTLLSPASMSICHVAVAKVVVEAPAADATAAAPAADGAKPAS